MTRMLAVFGAGLFVALLGLWVVAAVVPIPAAPLRLHGWWPLPLACVGARCVSYQALAARAAADLLGPVDLLSRVVMQEALQQVARSHGLSVTDRELDTALSAIDAAVIGSPELKVFLEQSFQGLQSPRLKEGMKDLLLRQKLRAVGLKDIWALPHAPRVIVLHARYRWDDRAHAVVPR